MTQYHPGSHFESVSESRTTSLALNPSQPLCNSAIPYAANDTYKGHSQGLEQIYGLVARRDPIEASLYPSTSFNHEVSLSTSSSKSLVSLSLVSNQSLVPPRSNESTHFASDSCYHEASYDNSRSQSPARSFATIAHQAAFLTPSVQLPSSNRARLMLGRENVFAAQNSRFEGSSVFNNAGYNCSNTPPHAPNQWGELCRQANVWFSDRLSRKQSSLRLSRERLEQDEEILHAIKHQGNCLIIRLFTNV